MASLTLLLLLLLLLLLTSAPVARAAGGIRPNHHHLLTREEPPGSGWRTQLSKTHPGHPLVGHRPTVTGGPPGSDLKTQCPNATIYAAVQQAGLLSVKLFGARGDYSGDDAPAVRLAMNMSSY